ncbi:MAG: response regulator, partial [Synergistaceae bacterium]|nr:response regulator [Synergistaceae bacterium]
LGLPLVKNIVDIMHGKISIHSEYYVGTTATLIIPQKISDKETCTVAEYREYLEAQQINEAKSVKSDKTQWPGAKVLIVDDTPVNLVVAKGMLKDTKVKIDTAESGEEALDKIKAEHYDLIFLDHKMPGLDGIETLKQAKPNAQDTPFIALTANAGANARNEYIHAGFNDYLPKPFKSSEMINILRNFLA